ncbi:hypothetical protein N9R79_09750 [Vibrio sp.]|nr:hypothetical protein [Vibrio sp.]
MKGNMALTMISLSMVFGCSSISEKEARNKIEVDKVKVSYEQEIAMKENKSLPSWMINEVNHDSEFIYGIGIGESKDIMTALKMAKLEASYDIAKKSKQEINGIEKIKTKDNGYANRKEIDNIVSSKIEGIMISKFEVVNQEVKTFQGKHRVYLKLRSNEYEIKNAIEKNEEYSF